MSKGVIKNRARALQLNDFSGLVRHRGITPTDIDGCIDYNGQAFLFMEGKLHGAMFPQGQRRFFKSLCDAITDGGRMACAVTYRHGNAVDIDVDVAICYVEEAYWAGKWIKQDCTVTQFIERFEKYATNKGFKI